MLLHYAGTNMLRGRSLIGWYEWIRDGSLYDDDAVRLASMQLIKCERPNNWCVGRRTLKSCIWYATQLVICKVFVANARKI